MRSKDSQNEWEPSPIMSFTLGERSPFICASVCCRRLPMKKKMSTIPSHPWHFPRVAAIWLVGTRTASEIDHEGANLLKSAGLSILAYVSTYPASLPTYLVHTSPTKKANLHHACLPLSSFPAAPLLAITTHPLQCEQTCQ